MMVAVPFTAYYNTPNKSIRQNVARKGVVLHHAALTNLDVLRSLCMGAKQVSATAIVKDLNDEQLMTDEYRAWSLSDGYWDSALRSVETCNESTTGYTISDASHWTLARNVAYWAERDGFWPHRSGDPKTWTVLGHKEVYTIHGGSYATACPGGMDLNLVTTRAQHLLRGGGLPNVQEDDMKIVIGGTVALVGEHTAVPYTSMTGTQGFSIEANTKAYGSVSGLTQDQVSTLIAEARSRRVTLINDVSNAVLAKLPAAQAAPLTQEDIDAIAAASAEAVDDALADDFAAGGAGLTQQQVQDAAEAGVREVFADAADPVN